MITLETIFKNFAGHWSFERKMFSSENELQSTATGIAVFTSPEEEVMLYKETGIGIYPNNHENEFSKEYKYRLYSNSIDVYLHGGHDHGNHYQTYLLNTSGTELRSIDSHICKSDVYNSFYELLGENNFILITQMNGPRKDSIIKTVFTRQP